jgi:hypothetical protein
MQIDFSPAVKGLLPKRPGVSPEFLAASGAYTITAKEAALRGGEHVSAVVIPYNTSSGEPVQRVCDGGHPFERWRYDGPTRDGRRYAQRADSKTYGYLPHNLHELTGCDFLVVVEGEFKAMSLAEGGIPAVGIGGISSAMQDGQLVPGLRDVISSMSLEKVYFLGDSDTSLLYEFSREAVKLARLLGRQGIQVCLPRIGLDGPGKGIDDVKEALGTSFMAYWTGLLAEAELVSVDDTPGDLALRLFTREERSKLEEILGVKS